MNDRKEYLLAVELIKQFNYFRDSKKFMKVYDEVIKAGDLSPEELTSIYNHMVDIKNNNQQGAIVSGRTIRKIWNSINALSRRNADLEEENFRLRESLARINLISKRLSSEFTP